MLVKYHPLNDQVLVKLDCKKKSALQRGIVDTPTMLPSGVVVEVGRGMFMPGVGFVETTVKVGDHVAISLEGNWTPLPLSDDKDEVYVSISESLILGRLEGADHDSPWFKAATEDVSRVVKGR